MSGKRESKTNRTRRKPSGGLAGWWRQHRAWVSGLDRGQKIRYRLFQFLVVVCQKMASYTSSGSPKTYLAIHAPVLE